MSSGPFFVLCKDNIERATEQYMHSKQNNKKSDALLIILLKRRTKSLLFYFQRKQKQKQKQKGEGCLFFIVCFIAEINGSFENYYYCYCYATHFILVLLDVWTSRLDGEWDGWVVGWLVGLYKYIKGVIRDNSIDGLYVSMDDWLMTYSI